MDLIVRSKAVLLELVTGLVGLVIGLPVLAGLCYGLYSCALIVWVVACQMPNVPCQVFFLIMSPFLLPQIVLFYDNLLVATYLDMFS